MEKLEVQTGQKKEVATYNEQKFYEIAEKVARDLYIPQNELPLMKQKAMSFYLAFKQTPNADKCTAASIEAAFREAIESKLDLTKKTSQSYLIAYGNTLQFQSSYRGKMRIAYERNKDIKPGSFRANCIYKGDTFIDKILPNGRVILVKHERPPFDKRTNEIIGAYAVCTHQDNSTEIMSMDIAQIKKSWAKSRTGASVAKDFGEQMACRTILARFSNYLAGATSDIDDYDYDNNRTYIDNINEQPTYDINDEETIEVNEDDISNIEETNEIPKDATIVESVEIKEGTQKNEDGSFVIDYKEYLKDKSKYEKIEYYEDTKKVLVKEKQ